MCVRACVRVWPAWSRYRSCRADIDSCRSCSCESDWTSRRRRGAGWHCRRPSCSARSRWTRRLGCQTADCRTRRRIGLTTAAPTTPTSRSISTLISYIHARIHTAYTAEPNHRHGEMLPVWFWSRSCSGLAAWHTDQQFVRLQLFWQRLSTSAWTARPRRTWLTSVDRLATVAPEWDQRRPGYSTCRARDPHTATDHLLSQGQASEQLAACHTRSVTVQSKFQETAKDTSVWMTIAALVRLNWRLRNVLTYLFCPWKFSHHRLCTSWVCATATKTLAHVTTGAHF